MSRRRKTAALAAERPLATGMPVRRPDAGTQAEIRRQQILDAAAACFARSGFHGAGMAEIARTFGMSASHIYNFFESKEAIIEALVARDLEVALHRIETLRGERAFVRAIVEGVGFGVDERIRRSALDTEIVAEAARNPNVAAMVRAMDAAIRDRLHDILRELIPATAGLTETALAERIELLLVLFDGLMVRVVRHPELDREAMVRILRRIVHELFTADE